MRKNGKMLPDKYTINLAFQEVTIMHPLMYVPAVLIVLLFLALFGKFAVADRLDAVKAAEAEIDVLQDELEKIRSKYTDYDEVKEEYNRYTYKDYDRTMADRLDVLSLVEEKIFPVCSVQQVTVTGRTLSLTLEGLTLESTSSLIADLNADKLVEQVAISTYDADSDIGESFIVTQMTIMLADISGEGDI